MIHTSMTVFLLKLFLLLLIFDLFKKKFGNFFAKLFNWLIYITCCYPENKIHANEFCFIDSR